MSDSHEQLILESNGRKTEPVPEPVPIDETDAERTFRLIMKEFEDQLKLD